MFGFSMYKLMVLVAVVAVVWYGFKFLPRLLDAQKSDGGAGGNGSKKGANSPRNQAGDVEDMVQCPTCQAYVPARSASNCGRPNCPY